MVEVSLHKDLAAQARLQSQEHLVSVPGKSKLVLSGTKPVVKNLLKVEEPRPPAEKRHKS